MTDWNQEEAKGQEEARTGPVREHAAHRARLRWDDAALRARIDAVLNRHPAVGLAVGIVRDGFLQLFDGRGFADIASREPIGEDTVFWIGSITKVVTAITVMQLREEGLVDLDVPAGHTCARTNSSRARRFRAPTLRTC